MDFYPPFDHRTSIQEGRRGFQIVTWASGCFVNVLLFPLGAAL
jgi:hypothetical protein